MSSLFITIILCTSLGLSLIVNLMLIWYTYRAIQQITFQESDLTQVIDAIRNFNTHLQSVHDMELFYGDETLRYLLQHSSDLSDMLEEYVIFVGNDGAPLDASPEET
mgnify:CR=1 FL=1